MHEADAWVLGGQAKAACAQSSLSGLQRTAISLSRGRGVESRMLHDRRGGVAPCRQ